MPLDPSIYVHPQALCESGEIGARTRIWAFAHLLAGAVVGADCNICDHVFVEGGARVGSHVTIKNAVLIWDRTTIEDDAFIGPAVVFTNDLRPRARSRKTSDEFSPTIVCFGATIGANATIVCGTSVGRHAFVAAGTVVTRSVPDHALVAGNPAVRIGWVCECGRRLDDELVCACGRSYRMIGPDAGLEAADG